MYSLRSLSSLMENGTQRLFAFNLALLPIPTSWVYHQQKYPHAKYVTTFRVSDATPCRVVNDTEPRKTRNLLGVALFDTHLDLISESEVIININLIESWKNPFYRRNNRFEDFRLFDFHGKVYPSDTDVLLPIVAADRLPMSRRMRKRVLPNLIGTDLHIRILGQNSKVRGASSKKMFGKNHNFFVVNDTVWMEIWPVHARTLGTITPGSFQYGEVPETNQTPPQPNFVSDEDFLKSRY